ncbi:PqiC family protein [Herbaspirillum lusitanum]
MMSFNNNKYTVLAALLATALLSACGTSPETRFYTLATPASAGAVQTDAARNVAANTAGGQTFIEVLPVSVPERLARPQIVVRADATKVDVLEQERWSSPFNNELRDALAAGVSSRLGAIDVSRSGRPNDQPSYRIAIELRDLDAARNGQVQAAFGWTITRSDDRKTAVCRMMVVEPVPGSGVDAVVAAMQKAVGHAADAIANNVRALQAGQTVKCAN